MYIPRSILVLIIIVYLLFLTSIDWINEPQGAWFRPFFVGILVVIVAAWSLENKTRMNYELTTSVIGGGYLVLLFAGLLYRQGWFRQN